MKKYSCLIVFLISFSINAQVQRAIEGSSVLRKNILVNQEFNFFRDWTTIASFKSGIGETVKMYPIVFDMCAEKGYNMTGRDHIIAFDQARGV